MKVLLLTSSYPRSEIDSASVFLRELADNLAIQNCDVHILAPSAKGAVGTSREGCVTVHRFRHWPIRSALSYGSGMLNNLKRRPWAWLELPFFCLAMLVAAVRLIAAKRPHLLHAHWILPQGIIALLASKLTGTPYCVTLHGSDATRLNGRFARALKRLVLRDAAFWTANSKSTAAAAAGLTACDAVIIPMGVSIERFSSGKPARAGRRVILFIGRLIPEKGAHVLIEAFAGFTDEERNQTELWLVGDGEQRRLLEELGRKCGIASRVSFWGRVDHKRLPDYLAAASVLCVPSLPNRDGSGEGQGVVILEALAAGVAVVASRVGGIPEVIKDGENGILVDPGDVQALRLALRTLLEGPERRQLLASAGRVSAQRYSWEQTAQAFAALYRRHAVVASPKSSTVD